MSHPNWYLDFCRKRRFTNTPPGTTVAFTKRNLEENDMRLARSLVLIISLFSAAVFAHEQGAAGGGNQPYSITPVIKQAMSDTGLAGYEMLVVRLDIVPGGLDPNPHRHDADLFVYVLEGSIEVELDGRKATYGAGAMFHEPRNVLHSLLRNTSADQPASALAVFVIKSGREFLVPEGK